MKKVDGDLIFMAKNNMFNLICNPANCFNTMGAGFALQIKQNFPEACDVDRNTIKGYQNKLGNYTFYQYKSGLIVVNMYTQYQPGNNCDYDAIRSCFIKLAQEYPNRKVGIPAIGSGIAGGDFDTIWNIIEEETKDMDITMVIYDS